MLGHRGIATGAIATLADSLPAISASLSAAEGNDTLGADATLSIQGTLSNSEGDDILAGFGGLELQAALAAAASADMPTAAGALTVTASGFASEADDIGAADATLLISANGATTEGDDVASLSGTVDIVGSVFVSEGNDTLTGNGAVAIAADAAIAEGDDTFAGLAQMPIFYPRRGGVDERENYERRQREWQEDLRRIIDEAWLIAYGIIDPVTRQPLPPPDYSTIIEGLLDQALTLDRQRTDAFIAEQRRLAEDDAIAILLLAA